MTTINGIVADQLRSFIERVERLREEKKTIEDDLKEVFAEAKAHGYDVKIMKEILRERAMEPADRDERSELLDLYRAALGMVPATHVRDAREAA